MSSFFKDNMPGKSRRNEIPNSIKDNLKKILSTHLYYACAPEKGTATVTPSNTPMINAKGIVESVQISDLYDVSQINFMNGEIQVISKVGRECKRR